jgi:hypothetical protein
VNFLLTILKNSITSKYLFARAGVAQLAEYKLPKLGVAGSIPVTRSTPSFIDINWGGPFGPLFF